MPFSTASTALIALVNTYLPVQISSSTTTSSIQKAYETQIPALITPSQITTPAPIEKCAIKEQDALSWCTKSISEIQGCTQLCDRDRFIQMCIADVTSVCSYVFCDDFKNAYTRQCASKAQLLVYHPNPEYVTLATQVQQTIGIGFFKCNDACAANGGTCGDYGCECKDGFSGLNCDQDLRAAVHYNTTKLFCASGMNQTMNSLLIGNATASPSSFHALSGSVHETSFTILMVFLSFGLVFV